MLENLGEKEKTLNKVNNSMVAIAWFSNEGRFRPKVG